MFCLLEYCRIKFNSILLNISSCAYTMPFETTRNTCMWWWRVYWFVYFKNYKRFLAVHLYFTRPYDNEINTFGVMRRSWSVKNVSHSEPKCAFKITNCHRHWFKSSTCDRNGGCEWKCSATPRYIVMTVSLLPSRLQGIFVWTHAAMVFTMKHGVMTWVL